ncbi:adenosine receptor A1-like [Littorina saxatilis]|uniref:adenosine receptor A1-like n=1 Tax=Littorina saxatilis TaxID=31220 RepID=UPI0038B5B50F
MFLATECVVSFLTVVTNGLVLAAVVHNPALRKPGNWFVVNLAVADLFVGVLTPPLVIISETSVIKNFYLCILNNSVIGAIVINSFTSLACLVYDRFSLVRNAFHTSTTESVMAKLGLSWVVSLAFGMVPLMGWHNDRSEYRQCRYREVIPLEYNVYLQMFGFFIPFLLAMLIVHTLVFREFRKSNRLMAYKSHETRRLVRYLTKREKRLFESLVLIFILFTVCWLPHYIVTCIHLFCPETMVNFYMEFFFVTLTHTNSVVNPVVYALGQSEFRHALHKLFPFLFTADKYYQGTSSHMRQIPSCEECWI